MENLIIVKQLKQTLWTNAVLLYLCWTDPLFCYDMRFHSIYTPQKIMVVITYPCHNSRYLSLRGVGDYCILASAGTILLEQYIRSQFVRLLTSVRLCTDWCVAVRNILVSLAHTSHAQLNAVILVQLGRYIGIWWCKIIHKAWLYSFIIFMHISSASINFSTNIFLLRIRLCNQRSVSLVIINAAAKSRTRTF